MALKTNLKRIGAWALCFMLLLSCIPVSADDGLLTTRDYSAGYSLDGATWAAAGEGIYLGNKNYRTVWYIPVYYYYLDAEQNPILSGTTQTLNINYNGNITISSVPSDIDGTFYGAKVATSASGEAIGPSTSNKVGIQLSASRSGYYNNYRYTLTAVSSTDTSNKTTVLSGNASSLTGSDYAVYVRYTPNTVTATFVDSDGTTQLSTQNVTPGTAFGLPTPTAPEGTSFAGWKKSDDTSATTLYGGTSGNSTATIDAATTFVAVYSAAASFQVEEGLTAPAAQTVLLLGEGNTATVTMPEAPVKEGYTFAGWRKSDDTSEPPTLYAADTAVTIRANTTFVAVYTPVTYTVTYQISAETTYSGDESDLSITCSPNEQINLISSEFLFREEYYGFDGWEDADTGTIYHPDTDVYVVTKDTTFRDRWTRMCVVTFDPGEGSLQDGVDSVNTIVYPGETILQSELDSKHEEFIIPYNKKFSHWEDENGNIFTAQTPITGDITLIAQYVDQEFCITGDTHYVAVDGQLQLSVLGAPEDAEITWSSSDEIHATVDESGVVTGVAVTGESPVTITATWGDQTASYEVYVVEHVYTVVFEVDGVSVYEVPGVPQGASLSDVIAAHAEVDIDLDLKISSYNWLLGSDPVTNQTVTGDTTLTGAIKTLTVTFLDSDGSTEYTTVDVQYGDTVGDLMPSIDGLTVPEGQRFVEWRYQATEGEVLFTENTVVTENMTVYPHLESVYTVTFYTDSTKGTLLGTPVYVAAGEPFDTALYPSLAAPEGQTLRYWVDATQESVQVFNPNLPINENKQIYPVFDKYVYVFVDSRTGETLGSVYQGDPIQLTVEAPEGKYYIDLTLENNTSLATDGTATANAETLGEYEAVNGRYTVPVTPNFGDQLTITFHADEDSMLLNANNSDGTYTVTVDAELRMPGALDIVRTDSEALVLKGWARTANATTAEFTASEVYSNAALEGVTDLYPVWEPADDAITITFVSNYPAGAVDADGNTLTEVTYVIYVPSGTKPIMPSLASVGMQEPANTYTDSDSSEAQRYLLSGWSIDPNGVGDNAGTVNGVYVVDSQYQQEITESKTFNAIWIDATAESTKSAHFFIRADGKIPQEPGGYESSNYYPTSDTVKNHRALLVANALRNPVNVVNDTAKVSANLLNTPTAQNILDVLPSNVKSDYATRAGVTLTADNFGTVWTVEWYACKYAAGHTPAASYPEADDDGNVWHVDGRIRILSEFELRYWPNGGSSNNIPPSNTYQSGVTVTLANGRVSDGVLYIPERQGYTFLGWDENPDATTPTYPYSEGTNNTLIMPNRDVDLYAIWKPNFISITLNGTKTVCDSNGNPKNVSADAYTFKLEQLIGGEYREIATTTNGYGNPGSFSFTQNIEDQGLYTFRVTEVAGSDATIAYDGSVFIVTVYVRRTDSGLSVVGQSVSRNGVMQTNDTTMGFVNRVGVRNVTVRKVWNDNNDQDGIRPSTITVALYQNGAQMSVEYNRTLSAANNWTATWEGLPLQVDSQAVTYTVKEVGSVTGYTSEVTGDQSSEFVITNTHVPATTEITVTKVWQDGSDATGKRPDAIKLVLTGKVGDTTVVTRTQSVSDADATQSDADTWTYTFTDLPQYYRGGNAIVYTVDETTADASAASTIPGYTKSISGMRITNTLTTHSLTVRKTVTGNLGDKNKEFTFSAVVYGANDAEIATGSFTLKHGQERLITNIPYGAKVVITEASAPGYKTTTTVGQATQETNTYTFDEILDDTNSVSFTNDNTATIDTGVTLDFLPYVLLILGVGIAVALWLVMSANKRKDD